MTPGKRRLDSIKKAWEYFLRYHALRNEAPALSDIIAFMFLRVRPRIPGNPLAGGIKLDTFLNVELKFLISSLQEQYGESFTLTLETIRPSLQFRDNVDKLRNREWSLSDTLGDRSV